MKTRTVLLILNIAGLIGSLIWLMTNPNWEPLIAVIGLIATLIAQLYGRDNASKTKMTQKGGKGSTNYQSKGNININSVK